MKIKTIIAVGIIAVIALFGANIASANPSQIVPTVQTSSATTTPAFLGIGATSTLTYDAYSYGQPLATNGATLLLQTTASSSSSVLNIAIEYSQDNIDWYQNNLEVVIATTSQAYPILLPNSYVWTPGVTTNVKKAIGVKTPTRYMRAVIVATTASSSVWAQFVPTRETN